MIWDLMNLEELSGIRIAGAPLEKYLFAPFHRVSEPWNADPKRNYPDTRSIQDINRLRAKLMARKLH